MARRSNTTSRRNRDEDDQYDEQVLDNDADEDEEDDAPRRSRGRSRRDADEDEAPRGRGRGRSRSNDDDEDDERPARSRRSRSRDDDDDEDERPSRGRGRGRSRDEDEERPKRERGTSTKVGRGWGAVDKIKTGDFVNRWQVPEQATLIKFLEPEPFSVYDEHFLEDLPKGTKKSYVCLGDDCPICDELGDRAASYAWFNILDLSDPDNPKAVALRASVGLAKDIQAYAEQKRTKPINRWDVYFTLHRKRQQGARYKLEFVPARDVEEYYDFEPFEEVDLEQYETDLITEEQVCFINTRKDLQKAIALLDD